MTLVEFHAIWERFAEARLVAALNAFPQVFITENAVRGMTSIPAGLAVVLFRGGGRYFDFRSCEELIRKGKQLVGDPNNPFQNLPREVRDHLDTMAAIRNWIVHRSEAAKDAYKRRLDKVFGITSAPDADEFLNAIDNRRASPAKGLKRLLVIERVVRQTISPAPTPE